MPLQYQQSSDLVMPDGNSWRDTQTGAVRGNGGWACLPRRRSSGTISQPPAAPVGREEPSQFAAITTREDEVAPRAGPLRAIAIRPQVALPARRALLPSASPTDAHLPTVTRHPAVPTVTRLPTTVRSSAVRRQWLPKLDDGVPRAMATGISLKEQ